MDEHHREPGYRANLGCFDGRDHTGVGAWLLKRPLPWRLGVQVVAIDPSAAFRKALRMRLPRAAVSVDHFHLIQLANQALTEVRQQLSHQVRGRRGRTADPAWAHRMLLLRAADSLLETARTRLENVFATDDDLDLFPPSANGPVELNYTTHIMFRSDARTAVNRPAQ